MRISTTPFELARRAATVLGSGLEASIIFQEHGVSVAAGSSTVAAARCDQAEARAETGPCIDSIHLGTVQVVPVVAESAGWDAWRAQTLREGFVSALAVPAFVNKDVAVALNLYSRAPDPWNNELLTAADGYAQLAASVVALNLELAELEDATAGLYRQLSDAAAVERAVGAVMHSNDTSESEARRIIESASKNRNVTQRDVAETILRALVVTDAPSPEEQPGA
ncbi:ANTAR domain-containing protein [Promicromonospora kroppenstedtii]|uniref:ANTAR domain-containing protein n=1 Tax=Promicromonospora kroppenstedtii TaxID=440482 RepID=A0ABW7XNR1_9MICO